MQVARCAARAADTPIAHACGLYGAETGTAEAGRRRSRLPGPAEGRGRKPAPGVRPAAAAKLLILVAAPASRGVP